MRLSLRLAKLVHYTPDKNKRPGIIKAIVDATGLDRHLVSNLLRNVARGIPLDALSRLCEFLVDHGYCSPDQLPGALFGVEAETFWELLARRQRLELCVGVRSAEQPEWPERAWVVASDAVLVGELLNGVSTLGGTTQLRVGASVERPVASVKRAATDSRSPESKAAESKSPDGKAAESKVAETKGSGSGRGEDAASTEAGDGAGGDGAGADGAGDQSGDADAGGSANPSTSGVSSGTGGGVGGGAGRIPHPEHMRQSLVWSPGAETSETAIERARQVYDDFGKSRQEKALVCLGSMKSNPVAELVMAAAFDCQPFQSQDASARASERACPLFLRYRDRDPHPDSCWGGTRLAADVQTSAPGIYYEQADGTWAHCGSDESGQDVAFVFYVNCEPQGWMEMVVGGFSGRATRLLAKTLSSRAEHFWPPTFSAFGKQFGAYIVKYSLPKEADHRQDLLRTDVHIDPTIIPLDAAVFQRRLKHEEAEDRG
jgi:hypothetical protein